MVVGRAMNGWEETEFTSRDINDGCEAVMGMCKKSFVDTTDCPLSWVEEGWGEGDKGEYRTSKSAFWRMARRLAEHYVHCGEGWSSHLCGSNLMRVSPACRGNPPEWSYDAQLPYAAKLLAAEVEAVKPSVLLIFAGEDWFDPFAEELDPKVKLSNTHGFRYITAQGSFAGYSLVVAPHPMGKKEDVLMDEIVTCLAARPDNA